MNKTISISLTGDNLYVSITSQVSGKAVEVWEPSLFGLLAMVVIMTTTVTAMATSQAFSLCPSVPSTIAASLRGMLSLAPQLLPSPTAVAKHGVQTSRL